MSQGYEPRVETVSPPREAKIQKLFNLQTYLNKKTRLRIAIGFLHF